MTEITVRAFCFIDVSDRAQAEFSYRHRVADQRKGFRVDQLVVGEVVDGDVFGAEVQVFGGAVEGIGFLGTVLGAELAKADAVILDKPLGLKP